MTRRLTTIALLTALVLSPVSRGVALAHDGHDHKVMGTITMAAADHVMLKSTDNENLTILVTKDTKVTKDKQTMRPQDIKVGTRVVVIAVSESSKMTAKEILVGAEAKAAE